MKHVEIRKGRHMQRGWDTETRTCQACRFMVPGKDGQLLCKAFSAKSGDERPPCSEVRAKHDTCPKWRQAR